MATVGGDRCCGVQPRSARHWPDCRDPSPRGDCLDLRAGVRAISAPPALEPNGFGSAAQGAASAAPFVMAGRRTGAAGSGPRRF
jgi:hypothetical protein